MIIAEESLKLLDEFLNAVKHSGVLFKYKTAFVTILHDFMATLVKFYKDNNCSNYHNLLNCSITLLIIHCHSTLPSSLSIGQFWKESLLPADCSIKTISEPYFRMNLAPFFEITGEFYKTKINNKLPLRLTLICYFFEIQFRNDNDRGAISIVLRS